MDHSGLNDASSSRTASRMRRLMRLRMTALPSALGRGEADTWAGGRGIAARLKAAKSGHV